MDRPSLRSEAIAELERMIVWLKADEPLPLIGCVVGQTALRLMGKKHR